MSMQPIGGNSPIPSYAPNASQYQGTGSNVDGVAAGVAPVSQPQTAEAVQAVAQPVNLSQVKDATDKLNKVMQGVNRNLNFTVDEDTGLNIVKVVDVSTKEVIRQIPSPEVVQIAKSIDQLQGLLLKQKA